MGDHAHAYAPLSQYEKGDRHTIVLAGAAGTGKSTMSEAIEEYAQQS